MHPYNQYTPQLDNITHQDKSYKSNCIPNSLKLYPLPHLPLTLPHPLILAIAPSTYAMHISLTYADILIMGFKILTRTVWF